jgi:small subunit ribosomal protein S6
MVYFETGSQKYPCSAQTGPFSPGGGANMKAYEILYIIRPDMDEEATTALVDRLSGLAASNGAQNLTVEKWGKRRLAYEIKDYKEGQYILMNFDAEGKTSQEVERVMKISDDVIRFLTVRKDD